MELKLRFQTGLMVPAGQYARVNPVKFILLCLAGWMQREQQAVIDYLQEEVRVLKEAFGERKPRFSDAQRIRLAAKAKKIKFGRLREVASIVTPQTLLRWCRELVAKKYDSSRRRRRGRPTTPEEIAQLVVGMAADNERWGDTRIRDALMNLGQLPDDPHDGVDLQINDFVRESTFGVPRLLFGL